jgi:hypothetical protein
MVEVGRRVADHRPGDVVKERRLRTSNMIPTLAPLIAMKEDCLRCGWEIIVKA